MGTLEAVVVGRQHQFQLRHGDGFRLVHVEQLPQHGDVRFLEVVGGKFDFPLVVNVAVFDAVSPVEIVHVVHLLEVHGDPFDAVGDFRRNGFQVEAARGVLSGMPSG